MADIRKRDSKKKPYQVRWIDRSTKSGFAYRSFARLKDAQHFKAEKDLEEARALPPSAIQTIHQAIDEWLNICEKEGTDGHEPVTKYTLVSYQYFSTFMKAYDWQHSLRELTTPDIVKFRSWLLNTCPSRYVARKCLSYFHSVLNEMALRGHMASNVASGVSIRADSRYDEPIVIPTRDDVRALLAAADRLANSKNAQISKTWERYRPILYLAADSGMRPQEYLALARSNILDNGVRVDRAIEGGSQKISVTKTPAGRRFIELSAQTLDMVRHYSEHCAVTNDHDLVFPTVNGKWQCPRNWRRRAFNMACLEAGLVETAEKNGRCVERPKYRPYDLRHFYASMLFEKKTNLKKIQVLMGHTNIATTLNVYGHLIEGMHEERGANAGVLGLMEL